MALSVDTKVDSIYVCGQSSHIIDNQPSEYGNHFVMRFNARGEKLWTKYVSLLSGPPYMAINLQNGDIAVTGGYLDTMAYFQANSTIKWVTRVE